MSHKLLGEYLQGHERSQLPHHFLPDYLKTFEVFVTELLVIFVMQAL